MARGGARRRSAWLAPAGLYLFAVAVNLVGIGWGLPGQGRELLPPTPPGSLAETADRSWAAVQDPARNLTLGAPDPDPSETPARTLRRFYLFSADPDEVVALMAVARLNPLAGRWDPGITHYGGFFLYALGASFKLASAVGAITVRGDPSFYLSYPEAMGRIYLVGRLLVVLIGSLAFPLLWIMARPMYGGRIALVAAGAAAVAPAWIVWGHVMKPWAWGAPFALAAMAAGRHLIKSGRPWRDASWAGALAGLAAGVGLPYALVILGPWLGIALRREDSSGRRLMCAAVVTGTAAVALLAVQPYWLFNPARTVAAWQRLLGWTAPDYRPAIVAAFAWGTLGTALGLPLMAAGIFEGLWQLWRRRDALPILVPTFATVVTIAVKTGEYPGDGMVVRWVLPATLVLGMLGVGGLWRLARALPRQARLLPALLVMPTLLISCTLLRSFIAATGTGSTRHLAGAWVNALPDGTSIGALAPLAPFRSPYFRIDRYRLVIDAQPDRMGDAALPDYFMVSERSELPGSPGFLALYREVHRFEPPAFPLGATAFAAYPFANPPITIYARRDRGS